MIGMSARLKLNLLQVVIVDAKARRDDRWKSLIGLKRELENQAQVEFLARLKARGEQPRMVSYPTHNVHKEVQRLTDDQYIKLIKATYKRRRIKKRALHAGKILIKTRWTTETLEDIRVKGTLRPGTRRSIRWRKETSGVDNFSSYPGRNQTPASSKDCSGRDGK